MRLRFWFSFPVLLFAVGCSRTPKAPLLRDEPVYQNRQAGFRFQVPDGWKQVANGDLPPEAPQERLLVEYKALTTDQPAAFQVTVIDLPATTNLEKYLTGPSFGSESWRPTAKPETFQINGVEGTRFIFESQTRQENLAREVVAFRRKERVYLFTGVFGSKDTKAREQIRGLVKSTIWK
jgi:hypothetical protein